MLPCNTLIEASRFVFGRRNENKYDGFNEPEKDRETQRDKRRRKVDSLLGSKGDWLPMVRLLCQGRTER